MTDGGDGILYGVGTVVSQPLGVSGSSVYVNGVFTEASAFSVSDVRELSDVVLCDMNRDVSTLLSVILFNSQLRKTHRDP